MHPLSGRSSWNRDWIWETAIEAPNSMTGMRTRCSELAEYRKGNSRNRPCPRFPEDAEVALNGKAREYPPVALSTHQTVCPRLRRMFWCTFLLTLFSDLHNATEATTPCQQALAPEHTQRRISFMSMSIRLSGCCHHSGSLNRVDNQRYFSHRTSPPYSASAIQACRVPQNTTPSYLHIPDSLLTSHAGLPTQQPQGLGVCRNQKTVELCPGEG